jgi:hypothetical protein
MVYTSEVPKLCDGVMDNPKVEQGVFPFFQASHRM